MLYHQDIKEAKLYSYLISQGRTVQQKNNKPQAFLKRMFTCGNSPVCKQYYILTFLQIQYGGDSFSFKGNLCEFCRELPGDGLFLIPNIPLTTMPTRTQAPCGS